MNTQTIAKYKVTNNHKKEIINQKNEEIKKYNEDNPNKHKYLEQEKHKQYMTHYTQNYIDKKGKYWYDEILRDISVGEYRILAHIKNKRGICQNPKQEFRHKFSDWYITDRQIRLYIQDCLERKFKHKSVLYHINSWNDIMNDDLEVMLNYFIDKEYLYYEKMPKDKMWVFYDIKVMARLGILTMRYYEEIPEDFRDKIGKFMNKNVKNLLNNTLEEYPIDIEKAIKSFKKKIRDYIQRVRKEEAKKNKKELKKIKSGRKLNQIKNNALVIKPPLYYRHSNVNSFIEEVSTSTAPRELIYAKSIECQNDSPDELVSSLSDIDSCNIKDSDSIGLDSEGIGIGSLGDRVKDLEYEMEVFKKSFGRDSDVLVQRHKELVEELNGRSKDNLGNDDSDGILKITDDCNFEENQNENIHREHGRCALVGNITPLDTNGNNLGNTVLLNEKITYNFNFGEIGNERKHTLEYNRKTTVGNRNCFRNNINNYNNICNVGCVGNNHINSRNNINASHRYDIVDNTNYTANTHVSNPHSKEIINDCKIVSNASNFNSDMLVCSDSNFQSERLGGVLCQALGEAFMGEPRLNIEKITKLIGSTYYTLPSQEVKSNPEPKPKESNSLDALDYREFYSHYLEMDDYEMPNGDVKAFCPFHGDSDPSLSVNLKTGKWYCFGGCKSECRGHIYEFLQNIYPNEFKTLKEANRFIASGKWKEWSPELSYPDGIPDKQKLKKKAWVKRDIKATETYIYESWDGKIKYSKTRYDLSDGSKTFQISDDRIGFSIFYKEKGMVEALKNGKDVYIVEGERKVHVLESHGFTATSLDTGSKSVINPRLLKLIKDNCNGSRFILLPDHDRIGEEYMERWKKHLDELGVENKIIKLPVDAKEDIVDYFNQGHSKEDLQKCLES